MARRFPARFDLVAFWGLSIWGMSRFLRRHLSAFGLPRFSLQRHLSAFGLPRFGWSRCPAAAPLAFGCSQNRGSVTEQIGFDARTDSAISAGVYVASHMETLPELEGFLGHTFSDRSLLLTALRHRSYVNERAPGLPNNQVLEFLGDAVLQLAVTHLLMEPEDANQTEGALTLLRSHLVSEARLAKLAQQIELGRFLLLGRGEELNQGRNKPSVLADAYEAVFGALYKDAGFEAVLKVARRLLAQEIKQVVAQHLVDSKSALQTWLQAQKRTRPRYEIVGTDGPEHSRVFEVAVYAGEQELGRGRGRSRREAEHVAAQAALDAVQCGRVLIGDRLDP